MVSPNSTTLLQKKTRMTLSTHPCTQGGDSIAPQKLEVFMSKRKGTGTKTEKLMAL
jgi:hypothetical protein